MTTETYCILRIVIYLEPSRWQFGIKIEQFEILRVWVDGGNNKLLFHIVFTKFFGTSIISETQKIDILVEHR